MLFLPIAIRPAGPLCFGQHEEGNESQHSQMGWKWFFQPPGHALLCKDLWIYWEKSCWFTGKKAAGVQKAQALSEDRACRGQPVPSLGNWGNCRQTERLSGIQSTPRRACEEGLCILETALLATPTTPGPAKGTDAFLRCPKYHFASPERAASPFTSPPSWYR